VIPYLLRLRSSVARLPGRRPCGGTTSTRRIAAALSRYLSEDHSVLVQTDRARLTGDKNLTSHIACRIFDRLPVKYPVPIIVVSP